MVEVMVASTSEMARPWVEAEIDSVVALTQGNPLLLTQLAGEFARETPPQPGLPDVASRRFGEVARRRVAGLDPAADEVIATIAHCEAVVDVALLAEVHGRAVADELGAGEAAGLIRVDSSNRVDFLHPSFAEAVRARSGRSAPAIHARLAQALGRRAGGPSHQVLVMRHLLASGSSLDRADVVAAAQTTATAARMSGDAMVEAEACEVLIAHHDGTWSPEREQLLLTAADAQFRAGHRERSWHLAAEVMANTSDLDALADAALGLARGQDYAVQAARVGNKVIEVARSLPPGHRLGPLLLARGAELLSCVPLTDPTEESAVQRVFDWTVRAEPVRSLVDEAVEMASRDGGVDATTRARLQVSWARLFRRAGDLPERRRRLGSAMGTGDDLKVQGEVALRLALDHLAAGDADGHRRALEAAARLVRASGDLELAWWYHCVVATLVLARGEPERAEDLSREAFEIGTRAGEPGRWTAAIAQFVGSAFVRATPVSTPFEVPPQGADHALLRAGRLWGQACETPEQIGTHAIDEVLTLVRDDTAREASWTLMSALLADAVWRVGNRDVAEELLEMLGPHRREVAIDFNGFYCAGCVARPLAGLAWLIADETRCVELEKLAIDVDGALGLERWVLQGRIDAWRRRLTGQRVSDTAATGELRKIADAAAARGMMRLSNDARALAEPDIAHDLTSGQREVLNGLAQHLTYQEIADRVGFSHSVVRKEAIAVYALLGADGRDDAVARAREAGLVP
jgi:DNA-binding CsgD family transcriptional regulator